MAYARYLVATALTQEHEAAARYYAGDVEGRDHAEPAVELRPDISEAFAARLGIDLSRPLTVTEVAHLMNNQRADGREIEGKKRHNAHRSVAEVFGLDARALPTVDAIQNILAGKRADGAAPRAVNDETLPNKMVESSLRAFKAAIGVPLTRDATPDEIARVADGRIDVADYQKRITATAPPVGFVDMTFSADKSVSISYALAPTEAERAIILSAVQDATADAMAYAETVMGRGRRGAGGTGEAEKAEWAWFGVQHYTARPATDIVRTNAQGEVFTDTREVPVATADPNLHQHRIVLSSMLTETGRISSLDLSRLKGEVKVIGAVFHAALATRLRQSGIDATLGPNGEARIAGIPEWVRAFHSRRTAQGEESAKEWAAQQGKDWDALDGEERVALLSAGAAKTRQAKLRRAGDEGLSDTAVWRQDAEGAGYRHRSVLRPNREVAPLTMEQRVEVARNVALPMLDAEFQKRAVVTEGEVREIAARGLIVAGVGSRPADDIDAVCRTFRDRGVTVAGEMTYLVWGMAYGEGGRPQAVVTTAHTVEQEKALVALVQAAAADKSHALTAQQIDLAADRFLYRNPRIDPAGAQWRAQRQMAHDLGQGGQISLAVGVAGSGKTSSVVATLVDAWHAEGRTVFGMTVPWKATAPLQDAGVDHAIAIDAFLQRVADGRYQVDRNSVIVADEVSMIGVRQQLALAKLATETGATLVEIGDPRQCQAVETPAIDLMCKAIGDERIPKLLTSIRQQTERGREVATMFRDGRAEEGVAAMRAHGHLHLVAGGPAATIQHTVAEWRRQTDANAATPDYSLLVMTATNARARDIGAAIRSNRREAGEIAFTDGMILKAMDPNSRQTFDLPVSVGDKLRMFTRTYDADQKGARKWLSSNGDVVEVISLRRDGMRIRNAAGDEGSVTWAQMKPWRAPKNDPVRVTYGYATSIDAAQSLTKTAALVSLPDGSSQVTGYKAYTALSRHVESAQMIISEAAERREIVRRQMLGLADAPREADIIRNIAANLGRFHKKSLATDMVRHRREAVSMFQRGLEPVERRTKEPALHLSFRERHRLATMLERVMDYAHQVQEKLLWVLGDHPWITQEMRDAARAHYISQRQDQATADQQQQEHQPRREHRMSR